MVQRGGGFGLTLEPLAGTGIVAQLGREKLERDVALQQRVLGQDDFAHAALAEAPEHAVTRNCIAHTASMRNLETPNADRVDASHVKDVSVVLAPLAQSGAAPRRPKVNTSRHRAFAVRVQVEGARSGQQFE